MLMRCPSDIKRVIRPGVVTSSAIVFNSLLTPIKRAGPELFPPAPPGSVGFFRNWARGARFPGWPKVRSKHEKGPRPTGRGPKVRLGRPRGPCLPDVDFVVLGFADEDH